MVTDIFLIFVFAIFSECADIASIKRVISCQTSIVQEAWTVKLKNVSRFHVPIPVDSKVAIFEAKNEQGKELPYIVGECPDRDLKTEVVFSIVGSLVPFPKKIQQHEPQYVRYDFYGYVPSVDVIEKQKTFIKTDVKFYDKLGETIKEKNMIVYGMYKDVEAWDLKPMRIQYKYSGQLFSVTRLHRVVELSHWTNEITVHDTFHVQHKGPELKDGYKNNPMSQARGESEISFLQLKLPKSASEITFKDEVGYVSTITIKKETKSTILNLVPSGYQLPLNEYLIKNVTNKHEFNFPLAFLFENIPVEEFSMEIVFPEGSANIESNYPFEIQSNLNHKFSYFDYSGRNVLFLNKFNLIEKNIKNIKTKDQIELERIELCVYELSHSHSKIVADLKALDQSFEYSKKTNDLSEFDQQRKARISKVNDELDYLAAFAKTTGSLLSSHFSDYIAHSKAKINLVNQIYDAVLHPTDKKDRHSKVASIQSDLAHVDAKIEKLLKK
ncbi:hypothetical protein ROZALSC1DRAFT_28509 [Rozella allomycis CSF55]|uniref:Dolichyl-diphosphooligosaccharide--protein glycosyltransferase subunit 1 n=1 Tax=Rozella allomycis (strain CSF55) TaxID=988480 RepID=A0A4P9YKH0_ROZAC|nr:hypothetical protein ROZALSC1DRAFT_28509 [Rozella allomycis CSF55]